jgi:hypothetical protein
VQNRWKVAKANNTERKQCGIKQCDIFHHRLLHKNTTSESLHAVVGENDSANVHYRIVPVRFFNGERAIIVNAMLDEGSCHTVISQDVAANLELSGNKSPLYLVWTDKETAQVEENSECVSLEIAGITNDCKKSLFSTIIINHWLKDHRF